MAGKPKYGSCTLEVHVVPRASANEVVGIVEGRVKIKVASPPVDGRSNRALTEVVAKKLGVARSRVEIIKGHRSGRKTLLIRDFDDDPYDLLLK